MAVIRISFRVPRLRQRYFLHIKRWLAVGQRRYVAGGMAFLMLAVAVLPIVQQRLTQKSYALGVQESALLSPTSQAMADKIKYDASSRIYAFNSDYQPLGEASQKSFGGPQIAAEIHADPKNGVTITDPVSKVDFTIKPKFRLLGDAKQDKNRLIYPLAKGNGHLVYTAQSNGVKEDITLQNYAGDKLSFEYKLELGDSLAARLLPDGSLGVYGTDLPINGDVSTGSDKDAALLQKARQNAPKNKLLFALPAPIVNENGRDQSVVKATFILDKDILKISASNLKNANYPLSIDPTVTVASATDFFRDTNNDTNADFDVAGTQIKPVIVTGGNIAAWTANPTNNLNTARFLHGTATYNGYVYVVGGSATTGSTANYTGANYVEQATIGTGSPATIGAWTAGVSTGLPAGGLSRFSLVAHNGYLYAFGGSTTDTTGATRSAAIYYARIQSNGVLSSWATASSSLPTAKFAFGGAISNGYLYAIGGKTGSGTATTDYTTESVICTLLPNGDTSGCTTTIALPARRTGHDLQIYNGYIYVIAGSLDTTLTATVLYAALSTTTGVIFNTWTSTSSIITARQNIGATFTSINNGYIYLSGGCTTYTSPTCTTIATDSQLAQINADGSLGTWFANAPVSSLTSVGHGLISWRGTVYSVAGCTSMSTGSCATSSLLSTQKYADIAGVGATSGVNNTTSLPAGNFGHATVVLNGFLYVLGGCDVNNCNATRGARYQTSWATINSNGTLGSWTTESTSTDARALGFDKQNTPLLGSADCSAGGTDYCGLAGINAITYNGYIYVLGGYDGNVWNNAIYYQAPNVSTGATSDWTKDADLMTDSAGQRAVFTNGGYIYSVGGCSGTSGIGCSTYYTTAQRSLIGASGNPGAWSATGQQGLTVGRAIMGVAIYGGYIYLTGGAQTGGTAADSQLRTVLYAKIDSANNIVDPNGGASPQWESTTGSMVKKRRRTAAFAVNGFIYVASGHTNDNNENDASLDAEGTADDETYTSVEVGKVNPTTGDISSFSLSGTTITGRWNAAATFANGFAYITGGCTAGGPPSNCTTRGTTNEYVQVYNADSFGTGTWSNQPNAYVTNVVGAAATVYEGYIYIAGGCTVTAISAPTSCGTNISQSITHAPINPDGSLGSWVADTALLDTGDKRAFGRLEAVNGYLYFMGGKNSTGGYANVVYKSLIGASGVPGAFSSTSQTALNSGIWAMSSAVYNGRIYVTGGMNSSSVNQLTVRYSTINASGNITAWNTATSFTTARSEHSTVAAGGYLYVIGGTDGTNYFNDVQVGDINESTGNITAWSKTADIPYGLAGMNAFAANGYVYIYGGRSGVATTSCTNKTASTSVSANGNLSEWQGGFNSFTTARNGAAAGYYNGYIYTMGGDNCTVLITSNVIQSSGQQSQAVKSVFSRYVDFGSEATAQKFFATGTHFVLGSTEIDKWRLRYRASTTPTNSWGALVSVSPITFGYGSPTTFSPVNGAGTAQGASRYWQLIFDIDMSQTFTFTDDTQPTITKYDFNYSPGPSGRLRNGKTFQDQSCKSNQTSGCTLDARP